jgi:hypothetical protein
MVQSIKEGRTVPERPARHHKSRPVARALQRRPVQPIPWSRVLLISSRDVNGPRNPITRGKFLH